MDTTIKWIHSVSLIGLFAAFAALQNCEQTTQTEYVHDTLYVQIITVDSIWSSADSIAQGANITLSAQVSAQPEVGDITFYWFADSGSFDKVQGDTVTWKAPDIPGVYAIRVHATDGNYIGLGKKTVGVGMYVPSVEPYYVGASECASCHGTVSGTSYDIFEKYSMTAHSNAWATLMGSDHAASYCYPCHSVGYAGEEGNGGYDETPIAKFENVQCENCHGPGSAHISSLNAADITIDYSAELCGTCHSGPHHPQYDEEWSNSPHNFDPETSAHGAAANSYCQGCHEGVAALYRLSGDLSSFYGGGAVENRPDPSEVPLTPITCSVCHTLHGNGVVNKHQLRTVADVQLVEANGEAPVITEGGTGKLCMQCHHARRGPETQIAEGYSYFGPHANPQADMLAGKSAYHAVVDSSFEWAHPSHLNVENSCRTCHLHMIPYGELGDFAVTGHKFEPTVEACQPCHGTINDFDDIKALDDFDGDGIIEGIQSEVDGLVALLEEALVAAGLDTSGGVSIGQALGDTLRSTLQQREAGYNLIFVENDKSHGIHNPHYAVQLLQQSYKYLTGHNVPNGKILIGDNQIIAAIKPM